MTPILGFPQRETTLLRRSEGSGSFPSISISLPKPSFSASVGPAVADKLSTMSCKPGQHWVTHTGCYISTKNKFNFSSLLSSSSETKLAECQAIIFRQKHRVRFKVCWKFFFPDLNYGLLSHKYHYYVHINLVVIHTDNVLLIFRGPT